MKLPIIAPSILAANFANLGDEIRQVVAGGADWIHIDVMDGKFVPPITFGDLAVTAAKSVCSIPLDVHLMIERPEEQIDAFANAGAHNITIHYEATPHVHRIVSQIHARGLTAGVAITPSTPVSVLEPIIGDLELVLIMSINPGWAGQKFLPLAEEKIRAAASLIKKSGKDIRLQVDGGITPETSKKALAAGADTLVAASAIFHSKDYADVIRKLRG